MSNKVKLVVPEAPVPATAAAKAQRKFAQGGLLRRFAGFGLPDPDSRLPGFLELDAVHP